jgi:hypothetical protein
VNGKKYFCKNKQSMEGMSFFAFFAILMLIVIFVIIGGMTWARTQQLQLKVGDLVRTTFSGCPTVLTTALHGPNGEYAYDPNDPNGLNVYGFNAPTDFANGLHCDVFGSQGTYSSWISSGGSNFRTLTNLERLRQGIQLYFGNSACNTDADCRTNSFLSCGPGHFAPLAATSSWQPFNKAQPDAVQCPLNTTCSLCIGSNGKPDARLCNTLTLESSATGQCMILNPSGPNAAFTSSFTCNPIYEDLGVNYKYCNALLDSQTGRLANAFAMKPCVLSNNYSFSTYCDTAQSPAVYPFYCNFQPGNSDCMYGQECVVNDPTWSNLPLPGEDSVIGSANVCSGTILPDIVITLPWIAEGQIASINTDNTYNIDWRRINLHHYNIGPSDKLCPVGRSCDFNNEEALRDLSWRYNDCRYVLSDTAEGPVIQRHFEVKKALLGTSVTNPVGLGLFSSTSWTDAPDYTFHILSVTLYVSPFNRGTMDNSRISRENSAILPQLWRANTSTYLRTSWDLRSTSLTDRELTKIFFYSILPVADNVSTEQMQAQHLAKYREKVALSAQFPNLHRLYT